MQFEFLLIKPHHLQSIDINTGYETERLDNVCANVKVHTQIYQLILFQDITDSVATALNDECIYYTLFRLDYNSIKENKHFISLPFFVQLAFRCIFVGLNWFQLGFNDHFISHVPLCIKSFTIQI